MKKLILHIGLHKTGSTLIQRTLEENRASLEADGWHLFSQTAQGRVSSIGNANSWVEFKGTAASFDASLNPKIYKQLEKIDSNVILSAEELAWVNNETEVKRISSELSSIFDEIKIIVYLRRQDKQLLSHYHQGFKNPHSTARRFYGSRLSVYPKFKSYYNDYLDYYKKLSIWKNCFENHELIVRFFEKNLLVNHDPVSDFKSALDYEMKIDIQKNLKVNQSFNIVQSIISNSIFNVRKELWFELGQPRFINLPFFNDSKKPKIDESVSKNILTHFYTSNLNLEKLGVKVPNSWLIVDNNPNHEESLIEIPPEQYEKAIEALVFFIDNLKLIDFIKLKIKKHLKVK
ncbi:hypothetical protein BK026_08410 [Alteromonas sp. V450]|uniref:hypothetical protein n=1 Tax=Alteromonas sp. V450 TaxID=1912139 RepID=UPI0008FF68A7|nr:hypothetical protein [Alteromonas sp. V450]OJF68810.1 hypothetical protein BK026_08410 [Alteromonas sp. V450]